MQLPIVKDAHSVVGMERKEGAPQLEVLCVCVCVCVRECVCVCVWVGVGRRRVYPRGEDVGGMGVGKYESERAREKDGRERTRWELEKK